MNSQIKGTEEQPDYRRSIVSYMVRSLTDFLDDSLGVGLEGTGDDDKATKL